MMTPSKQLARKIHGDIKNVYDFLIESEIVINANEVVFHQYEADHFSLAWHPNPQLGYLLKSPSVFCKTSPLCHYIDILKRNDFMLLFADGSLMQIAYKVFEGDIQWHRLCYFPCPLAFFDHELAEFTILDLFDALSPQELLERTQMVTYVRFDFDRNFTDDKHTHSHFTFGNSECRVPVFGPVSISHFADFLIHNFLSSKFSIPDHPRFGQGLYDRTLPAHHSHPLFIESAV